MKPIYRLLTIFLIPTLFLHFWISGVSPVYAAMPDEKVTIFTPESVESEPIEAVKPPKKAVSRWWYVLLLAVAGGAAAASGGGGGGDSGGSTGTSTVTW